MKIDKVEEIIEVIDKHISHLKPNVKDKFVYGFRDYISGEKTYGDKNHDMFAVCNRSFGLPVLTFFPNVIIRSYRTLEEIKELVSHEVLHVLGYEHGLIMDEKVKNNHLYAD